MRFDNLGARPASIPAPNFPPPPIPSAALPPPIAPAQALAPPPVVTLQSSFEDDDLASWTPGGASFDEEPSPRTSLELGGGGGVVASKGSAKQFFQNQQPPSQSQSQAQAQAQPSHPQQQQLQPQHHTQLDKFGSKRKVATLFTKNTSDSKDNLSIEKVEKKEPLKAAFTYIQSKISKYVLGHFFFFFSSGRLTLVFFFLRDRNRFVNDQFNLDLTYITPRIIGEKTWGYFSVRFLSFNDA